MDLKKITFETCEIVKETAKFISCERENFDQSKTEIKAKNDLVSYVDREAEKMLVEGLAKVFPAAGFIAEENTAMEQKEFNWIIDPLDGTTNFIHGIPCYCISVALAKGNEIICGVVYEVARHEMFYTCTGTPSFLNGKVISVSKVKSLGDSLIATGFPVNNFDKTQSYFKVLDIFFRNTHGVRRIGAAAADLCYVACGRVDAFYEYNLKPWDVAAGSLIVKNAGGNISDFAGGSEWLFGKQIIACSPGIEKEFSEIIGNAFLR